jgi:putative membrane protein
MMFFWQRTTTALCLFSAALIGFLDAFQYIPEWFSFPSFPLAVVGGALGIFVSFRTNSAYQRWWEGRKLWGRMINTSRHLCTQSITYLPKECAVESVHRHIAYVHVLRCGLRNQDSFTDKHVLSGMQEIERQNLVGSTNLNHALLNRQMELYSRLNKQETINNFEMQSLDESVRHLLDIQGGCERIKKTPFPPVYGFLATRLTQLYAILLPLTLVHDIHLWIVPVNLVICMSFQLINEVGRVLENPFTTFWPALPLSAMSVTIERNLRQALEEESLPPAHQPIRDGTVLM